MGAAGRETLEDRPTSRPRDGQIGDASRRGTNILKQKTMDARDVQGKCVQFVLHNFDAVLLWSQGALKLSFELDRDSCSSTPHLKAFIQHSRAYVFVPGRGLIGRCAELEIGGMTEIPLTKMTTEEEYLRIEPAVLLGVEHTCCLHAQQGVVLEFVSTNRQRSLGTDPAFRRNMLTLFASECCAMSRPEQSGPLLPPVFGSN